MKVVLVSCPLTLETHCRVGQLWISILSLPSHVCGQIRTHVIHQPVAREYCVVTSSSGEPDMQVEETVIGIDKRNRCADILTKALPKEDFRFITEVSQHSDEYYRLATVQTHGWLRTPLDEKPRPIACAPVAIQD